MTTAMGTIPAPSRANRCWCLCGFTPSSASSCFSQWDRSCLFNKRSQERHFRGWSGSSAVLSRALAPSSLCLYQPLPSLHACCLLIFQDVCICSGDQERTGGRVKVHSEPVVLRLCFLFPSLELNLKATPYPQGILRK